MRTAPQNSPAVHTTSYTSNGATLGSSSRNVFLPLRSVTLTGVALGGIARTTLRQHFANRYSVPLELTYKFPLPADGAVTAYRIQVGRRTITGHVARRDEALAQFEAARLDGRTAGLVEQERPNLFTQFLGNIPAATDVVVELTIDHPVAWIAGTGWEWRFPTVAAPRYLGAEGTVQDSGAVTVEVETGTTAPTVSVDLTIGDALASPATSTTHAIVEANGKVTLASDAALDRDIAIRWAPASQAVSSSVQVCRPPVTDSRTPDAYGLVTIVPPIHGTGTFPRDLVLLLDASGSMRGRPLQRLKAVVRAIIEGLRDVDRLEMIAFASQPVRYRRQSAQATVDERCSACAWVDGLEAEGGTELIPALDEALRPLQSDVARQVILVTDGLIGFEASAVRAIRDGLPRGSRLHTVGVGSASNRALLKPAARAGRGVEIVIDLDEDAARAADRVVAATREPVVLDVALEGTALLGASPRLPDLLSGSPVVAAVRLRPEGGTLVLRGRGSTGGWEDRLDVPATQADERAEAVPALWARAAIEDLELELACGGTRAEIDQQIEQIALEHSVASRLTSWIAVAEEPDVDPREPVRVERIPQALPYGMSAEGLGVLGSGSSASAAATPASSYAALSATEPAFMLMRREVTPGPDLEPSNLIERRIEEMRERVRERCDLIARRTRPEADRTRALLEEVVRRVDGQREMLQGMLQGEFARLEHELRDLRAQLEADLHEMSRRRSRQDLTVPIVLPGRVLPTPGRSTATIEVRVFSDLHWQPDELAAVAGRVVKVDSCGTTRPGPVAAGSLVRLELVAPPADVERSRRIELRCGERTLAIELHSGA